MVLPLIGGLLGGLFASRGASKAADAQTEAARMQVRLQRQIYKDQKQRFNPYYKGGTNAFRALMSEMGLGNAPAGYEGFRESPGYQAQFDEGVNAVQAANAFRGGLNSGRTLKDLTTFGQNLADREYTDYYNRLAGLASGGQAAAGNIAAAGNAFASGASTAYGNIGNAQAAGAIGQANAFNDMIGNVVGAAQYGFGGQPNTSGMGWTGWKLGG